MTCQPATFSVTDALHVARDTRALELGTAVIERTPTVFRRLFGDGPAVLVADQNTFAAAGKALQAAFKGARHKIVDHFIFEEPYLHADYQYVTKLETALRQRKAIPIAVGSGTINDLTKLASYRAGLPYICVPTAASMDGYTAFGASITFNGLKQTLTCPAPSAVIADLNIIRDAPSPMNVWGYADLLAKFTAGADWILAEALGVEPVDPQAWAIAQGRLRELTADPVGVKRRDRVAVRRLVEGLLLSGFAMQSAQSSRPASGAEHHFSHLWDMQCHVYNGQPPWHGFKVGIGALATSALYEELLESPLHELDVNACCAMWPDMDTWTARVNQWFTDRPLAEHAARELSAKRVSREELMAQMKAPVVFGPGFMNVCVRNYCLSTSSNECSRKQAHLVSLSKSA